MVWQQIKQGQELRIGEDYLRKSRNPFIIRKLQLTTNTGKLPGEDHNSGASSGPENSHGVFLAYRYISPDNAQCRYFCFSNSVELHTLFDAQGFPCLRCRFCCAVRGRHTVRSPMGSGCVKNGRYGENFILLSKSLIVLMMDFLYMHLCAVHVCICMCAWCAHNSV